jgi:protein subunit release factor B
MTPNAKGELLFSVTLADCVVQTFRAGGSGGQNQNKRDTGVRIIHRASGARGEARDERSQLQNKKLAFRRMADSALFKAWVARQSYEHKQIEARAAKWAAEQVQDSALLKVEVFDGRRWKLVDLGQAVDPGD